MNEKAEIRAFLSFRPNALGFPDLYLKALRVNEGCALGDCPSISPGGRMGPSRPGF